MLNLRREPIDPNYKKPDDVAYTLGMDSGTSSPHFGYYVQNTPINNAVVTNSHINDSEINNCSIINCVITGNSEQGIQSPIATWDTTLIHSNTTIPEPTKLLNAIDAALSAMSVDQVYQYLNNLVNQTIITEFSHTTPFNHSNPEQEYINGPHTTFIYWVDGYERQVIKSGTI